MSKIILFCLIASLGSDDYDTRQDSESTLSKLVNNHSIRVLKDYKTNDPEIHSRLNNIIEHYEHRNLIEALDSLPTYPQLDMLIGHNEVFSHYRTLAIEQGYTCKYPFYNACRRATYLYFKDSESTVTHMYAQYYKALAVELVWDHWILCTNAPICDMFPGWGRPQW